MWLEYRIKYYRISVIFFSWRCIERMDNKQKDAPTKDLSPEQQEQYDMLMFEGKQLHPKTSTYILDLAIRFYLVHGDNMLNVKSLSEENLQKMKDKYETNAEEFFGSVEVVRKEDLTEQQTDKKI